MDSTGLHVYTCSLGSGNVWAYIRYKTSIDGGHSWGAESVALTSTAGSADAYPTCDPGVIYFGGFSSLVSARYIRITARNLKTDNSGNYYFQIADIFVD